MPVVQWVVKVGYAVDTRDGHLGIVREIFEGPPQSAQSIFVSTEPYMQVVDPGQPDLHIPFEEIVDVSEVKQAVYLKRSINEIAKRPRRRMPRPFRCVVLKLRRRDRRGFGCDVLPRMVGAAYQGTRFDVMKTQR